MLTRVSLPMKQTVTGFTQMMDGRGFQTIPGDGLLFIMAAGTPMPLTDLFGFRAMNGDRDGSLGEVQMIITAGLH